MKIKLSDRAKAMLSLIVILIALWSSFTFFSMLIPDKETFHVDCKDYEVSSRCFVEGPEGGWKASYNIYSQTNCDDIEPEECMARVVSKGDCERQSEVRSLRGFEVSATYVCKEVA